jgi:hypothetical protein
VTYFMRKLVTALLMLAFYCTGVRATTLIAIVTNDGIIFAADGVVSAKDTNGAWRAVGIAQKVVLVQQRFAFASFGYDYVAGPQAGPGRFVYDFPGFADRLNRTVPPGIDVSGFADAVESNTRFDLPNFFDPLVRAGQILKENVGPSGILIGYLVCGYENGIATIVRIVYSVDWEMKRVVGPYRTKPISVENPGSTLTLFCDAMCNAVRAIGKGEGFSYESAHKIAPKEVEALAHKAQLTALSIAESIRVARVLLEMETIANENRVGLPVSVVTIMPNGAASSTTFGAWVRNNERVQ